MGLCWGPSEDPFTIWHVYGCPIVAGRMTCLWNIVLKPLFPSSWSTCKFNTQEREKGTSPEGKTWGWNPFKWQWHDGWIFHRWQLRPVPILPAASVQPSEPPSAIPACCSGTLLSHSGKWNWKFPSHLLPMNYVYAADAAALGRKFKKVGFEMNEWFVYISFTKGLAGSIFSKIQFQFQFAEGLTRVWKEFPKRRGGGFTVRFDATASFFCSGRILGCFHRRL